MTTAAIELVDRARSTTDRNVLDQSILRFEQIFRLVPKTDINHHAAAINLANALITKALWTGDPDALARGVEVLREALTSKPIARKTRAMFLSMLAWALMKEAIQSGSGAKIKEVVELRRRALKATRRSDPLYLERLSDLATTLLYQFSLTGNRRALHEAVRVAQASVSRTPSSEPMPANRLSALATAQLNLASYSGSVAILTDAVENYRIAITVAGTSDDMPTLESNLGTALMRTYELTDSRAALDESIHYHRAAVAATQYWLADRPIRLSNLAFALLCLYERTGDLAILDEIVGLFRDTVSGYSLDHSLKTRYVYGLAAVLWQRAARTGDLTSLDESIDLLREVAIDTPELHPDRPGRLSALAAALYQRFQEDPTNLGIIDEAIGLLREALSLAPSSHVLQGMLLSNLGGILDTRAEKTDRVEILLEAIHFHRKAIGDGISDNSDRPKHMSNLAISLILLSRLTGDTAPLQEALTLAQQALDSLSGDDMHRAQTSIVLGAVYERQYQSTNDRGALTQAIETFQQAADSSTAPDRTRLDAGLRGGHLAAAAGATDQALVAFSTAIQLIDRVTWAGLSRLDQERMLSQVAGLPMDAAAMAITEGKPERAIELLEQGRGVLLASQFETPGQQAVLRERAPHLADEMERLQRGLEVTDSIRPIMEENEQGISIRQKNSADERSMVARKRADLISRITQIPGMEDLFSSPKFSILREAAADGPVAILNVSIYRCDALIVSNDGVQLVPLPELTLESVNEHANALADDNELTSRTIKDTLGWLWNEIVEPILRAKGITGPVSDNELTHIWWCGTGLSCYLPLHAAGNYTDTGLDLVSALDLVVSSYTSSLRSLIRIRERPREPVIRGRGPLIVAMPETPGADQLEGAQRESEYLASKFLNHKILSGPSATHAAVIDALRERPWAHFSCHGRQDLSSPSQGMLLLHDQPLTVEQIMALRLDNASFAFLSACETYRSGARIPDEGLTIAGALQLAGYRHVIATLWSIGIITAEIAQHVYDEIVTDEDGVLVIDTARTAHALRAAVMAFRRQSPSVPPNLWVPYVHTGA